MDRIKEQFLVSPFLVFFLIHSMQIGIGMLGFQRIIAKSAGFDSWISIIIVGICVHIIIWMIYRILDNSKGDIVHVHKEIFGKWIGGFISLLFILYLMAMSVTVLRSYIEVVEVWMFADFNKWVFGFFTLVLVYYIISGGFRTVTGISFFSVVLPFYILLVMIFPLGYAHVRNLLPIMSHSFMDIAKATKDMSLSIIGFEVILFYYPFIKDAKKSQKWAHLGALATTILYLGVALTAFMFYSEAQLDKQIWATLSMFKIVILPFVERFEYIGITSWFLVVLPNICLTLWASSRGIKRMFAVKQKHSLIVIMAIVLVAVGMFKTRFQINMLNDYMATFGFYFVFCYIPILFVLNFIIRKLRGKK
ncbi:GerAB/ArcD/ProY family transporter [Fredinandcohnia sp. 179-A 10B2 NHS]|uniref:GerAB/ArcD/ProY family transporter n=1 Tax=Fredinandcohnia sp. 179-A 10B2 NHS TaxID=3235176 RepID=UPI0039A2BB47